MHKNYVKIASDSGNMNIIPHSPFFFKSIHLSFSRVDVEIPCYFLCLLHNFALNRGFSFVIGGLRELVLPILLTKSIDTDSIT